MLASSFFAMRTFTSLLLAFGIAVLSAYPSSANPNIRRRNTPLNSRSLSQYGNLDSPTYPFYIQDQGSSVPAWSNNATSWFNSSLMPDTNNTRYYDFTVSRALASPDGYQKHVMLINGQFPGPLIEANWGDWIQVTLHNQITGPEEGTALHWHGLLQKETPWFEGVPSVQQCPVAPGASFTYEFRADRFGSSWYHSHYSAQYAGGLLGPLLIHGPAQAEYDIDLGPIFITDWYHAEYFEIIEQVTGLNQSLWGPSSQTNMINGRGQYDCSLVTDGTPCDSDQPLSQFQFTSGKTHRLRLVNAGAEGFEYFTIDGHIMTVIANDFTPVEPYNTTVVTLGIGQRTDVLVYASGEPTDSFWMRANNSLICARTQNGTGLAEIHYESSNTTKQPESTPWPFVDGGRCNNDALTTTIPYFSVAGPAEPAFTQVVSINKTINATGHQVWEINESSFRGDYNNPLLLLANEKNYSYPGDPDWNVYNFGSNASVRLIVNNESPDDTLLSHPMHIHGHDVYVVSEGEGRWDGSTIVRPTNPQRRDTQMLRRAGYVVLDIVLDNPGVWSFHCHIAWHISEGLYMNIMEEPADITQMQIPGVVKQTCDAWNTYSKGNVVEQIDSGLKIRKKERKVRSLEDRGPSMEY